MSQFWGWHPSVERYARRKGRAAASALLGEDPALLGDRERPAVAALRGKKPAPLASVLFWDPPEAWTAFDKEVRRLHRASPGALHSKRIEARLCDPDGRIRAAALRFAALGKYLPLELVVIRCADWAPAVRRRARRALGWLVARDPEWALAAMTPVALRLARREHGGWAVEQLEAALSGRYSLLTAWWRPGRPSREWTWTSLTGTERAAVLRHLRNGRDPLTVRFAARLASPEAVRPGPDSR